MKLQKKLFSEADPIGKTIEISSSWGENEYQVTGVFNRKKYASHLAGNFYVSGMSGNIGQRFYRLSEWGGNNLYYTYIQLQDGATKEAIEAKISDWLEGHAGERFRELGMHKEHYLTPITDIYLYTGSSNWFGDKGNITFLYLLMSVAAFIILIACINFMNLATAKATLRAKEVGVRKVIGASRGMLIKQFMSKALVYSTLAVVFAYVFSELLMPLFSELVDKDLTIQSLNTSTILGCLIGFILLVTLVAGSYPALYLSSFSPSKIFKNDFGNKLSSSQIRKGLVVLQFIISIALIQGILVINEQMNFISEHNLGFNPEAKLILPISNYEVSERINPLRNELLENNQIKEVSTTSNYPDGSNMESYFYFKEGQTPDEGFHALTTYITPEYLKMIDFELLKGRFFDANRLADTATTAVISEITMNGMGFNIDNVLVQKVYYEWDGIRYEREIIGIVKYFHTRSLHYTMQGQIFAWQPSWNNNFVIASVEMQNLTTLIKSIEQTWTKINPEVPFEYQFLDAQLQKNYATNQRMNSLISWGTMLAIFISCIGLLGLAAFAAKRREKEIGIRKILGASILNIVSMLSKYFVNLVIIALILATPIA
ncbi:MAG: putative ABC transport system permease protein [Paraglaciecola sp.]|jgi:putative ABC transport system permease protein